MKSSKVSRRGLLIGSSALVAGSAFSTRVLSAAPPASAITPQLIEAAKKEGKVVWYTSIDLPLAEEDRQDLRGQISPASRCASSAPAPSASCSASARNIGATSTPSTWSIRPTPRTSPIWKDQGLLAPYVPEDVAKYYPAEHKDPDGTCASSASASASSPTIPTW